MSRLLAQLRPALEATGLPWSTTMGTKHIKIYVGPRLVGVLPITGKGNDRNRRATLNLISSIRKAARELN